MVYCEWSPFDEPLDGDLLVLEVLRTKRFFELAQLPDGCLTHLEGRALHLHCRSAEGVGDLLDRMEAVKPLAWLVMGATWLKLWQNRLLVFECELFGSALKFPHALDELEEPIMTTATIDRGAIAQTARTEINESINSQIDEVIQQEAAGILSDSSALQQRVRERLGVFLNRVEPVENGAVGNGVTVETAAIAPATVLRTPKNYTAALSQNYAEMLPLLLPSKEGDRAAYLLAIAQETPEGKAWLTKVAAAVFRKFKKPAAATIYKKLLTVAKEMQAV
jgi:hypothetical protein